MHLDFLMNIFEKNKDDDAIVRKDKAYSYGWILDKVKYWRDFLKSKKVQKGSVTAIDSDFSPNSVALMLALIENSCIVVPLTSSVKEKKEEFIELAQCELSFVIGKNDEVRLEKLQNNANHEVYKKLRELEHPGLILFSSGSTGKSKAAVHDFLGILDKFKLPKHKFRTITFLLYDHIGGINTMLYTLSNGGCIITVQDRSPDGVLSAIEKHKVELLPTSPTFVNLILLSGAYNKYDLSSLKIVSYGTEPMLESTLKRFHGLFPDIKLVQTYGLSEVGILSSKSKSSDSLWVKVGGKGFETRIVDNILQIKAKSAMLGYLNAPSPFTEDGWFNTGDSVEVDGEYIKILGRKSEIINVGGQKVYPTEVENVIQEMDGVSEATVYSEKNPITGRIVCANVSLKDQLDEAAKKEFILKLKKFCLGKLERYKVPVKVIISDEKQHGERFKKLRGIVQKK